MGEAAIRFGLTGESYIINEPAGSGLATVALALEEIAAGTSQTMICGRCDLGRPPLMETAGEVAAGALFFVLQHTADVQRSVYGRLEQSAGGQIAFNGEEIPDLTALARQCLQKKR
jgi:3-oxoacyl-[acyl-carrier-protein] synthase II